MSDSIAQYIDHAVLHPTQTLADLDAAQATCKILRAGEQGYVPFRLGAHDAAVAVDRSNALAMR